MSAWPFGASREAAAVVQSLLQRLPGYVPEAKLAPAGMGYALLEVLARYRALLDIGTRGLSERNLLALPIRWPCRCCLRKRRGRRWCSGWRRTAPST